MTTEHFIIELFCRIDNQMPQVRKHPQARLHPSELVTLAVLFALKGSGGRAFYRWISRDFSHLFPHLNERTRLFRLFAAHQDWADYFLAEPTLLGVIDSYGVELIHPIREGRSEQQIGKKGLSNKRWIVGMKWCLLTNQFGLLVGWDCSTANVHDTEFQPLVEAFEDEMVILSDFGFHAAEGDPANLKICQPKTWSGRMVIETVFSMLTRLCHFKKMSCRAWAYFRARLSFAVVAFNVLVQWHGFKPDEDGFVVGPDELLEDGQCSVLTRVGYAATGAMPASSAHQPAATVVGHAGVFLSDQAPDRHRGASAEQLMLVEQFVLEK